MADIIFIHGASSSGKSTIARALQAKIEKPFWHISIDHLRDAGVLPLNRYKTEEFNWKQDRTAFFKGFHASLGAYADAGNNLILETILDTKGWIGELKHHFQNHDVLFVAIHCPLHILIKRERNRGDREIGSAERDFHKIHKDRRYDLELHTEDSISHNTDRILTAWRSGIRRSEFTT